MTLSHRPTCFVAMAFDHTDTDALYDSQILPTLKKLEIRIVRIDRRQSNDDINLQIIEQLQAADFCITDLTYARPSVYYEAGFAQRTIPVIYTARKDHLAEGQPDHLRVHFDLQMKPIILWKAPTDYTFASRLERRLRSTVLRGWQQTVQRTLKQDKDKQQLARLPLHLRLKFLRRRAVFAMKAVGIQESSFKPRTRLDITYQRYDPQKRRPPDGSYNYIQGETLHGKKGLVVSIQSFDLATKSDLQRINNTYLTMSDFSSRLRSKDWIKADSIYSHILIMSLRPVSATQIERIFDECRPIEKGRIYAFSRTYWRGDDDGIGIEFTVHVLSGIESFTQTKSWLQGLISNFIAPELGLRLSKKVAKAK